VLDSVTPSPAAPFATAPGPTTAHAAHPAANAAHRNDTFRRPLIPGSLRSRCKGHVRRTVRVNPGRSDDDMIWNIDRDVSRSRLLCTGFSSTP
jgi:hypothetical protein